MGAKGVVVFPPGKSAKILKWTVKEGTFVAIGRVLLLYDIKTGAEKSLEQKLKSKKAGIIRKLLVKEGEIIEPGMELLELEDCSHPTVMNAMCAECGADLNKEDLIQVNASVPMIHSIPELKVSKEQAEILGKADETRLLKDRKLVLLVDLDQTLIHTTNDNIPPNLKDVYHFQLYGSISPWYHTRIRPGTQKFLTEISAYYELHICTFGARNYAHMIAMFLDPDGKFFSHRILSRDECFSSNSKTANLKALFPCGDNLVCIIDDREDVWNYAPNLIHVKPYHFFQHTGDINAPPGLAKCENDEKEGYDFTKLEGKNTTTIGRKVKGDNQLPEDTKNSDEVIKTPDILGPFSNEVEKGKEHSEKSPNTMAGGVVKSESGNIVFHEEKCLDKLDSEICEGTVESKNDTLALDEVAEERTLSSPCERMEAATIENVNKESCSELVTELGDKVVVRNETASEKLVSVKAQSDISDETFPESPGSITKKDENNEFVTENIDDVEEINRLELNEEVEKSLLEKNSTVKENCQVSTQGKEKADKKNKALSEEDELVELEDCDDYLLYLEEILKTIHRAFYELYDELGGDIPDLKNVIPYVRRKVLSGMSLVFSGLVPTHVPLDRSRAYQVAVQLGAKVTPDLTEATTHLVAVRPGTAKVNAARRRRRGSIHLVTPNWLWACAERWEHVDERLFPLGRGAPARRHPPAHCASPTRIPPEELPAPRKRTPSGRFIDTINPLMSLSSEEIEKMDREVEDIFNESESEGEGKKVAELEQEEEEEEEDMTPGTQPPKLIGDSDSSSSESLTGGSPHGWKHKEETERRKRRGEEAFEEDLEEDSPSAKFRRGEELPSDLDVDDADEDESVSNDGSQEPPDEIDDGEWNMMGAALEREFLSGSD